MYPTGTKTDLRRSKSSTKITETIPNFSQANGESKSIYKVGSAEFASKPDASAQDKTTKQLNNADSGHFLSSNNGLTFDNIRLFQEIDNSIQQTSCLSPEFDWLIGSDSVTRLEFDDNSPLNCVTSPQICVTLPSNGMTSPLNSVTTTILNDLKNALSYSSTVEMASRWRPAISDVISFSESLAVPLTNSKTAITTVTTPCSTTVCSGGTTESKWKNTFKEQSLKTTSLVGETQSSRLFVWPRMPTLPVSHCTDNEHHSVRLVSTAAASMRIDSSTG